MDKKERPACMVCFLEQNMRKRKGLKDKFNMNARTQGCISSCTHDGCSVKAHSMKMMNEREIFQMECFKGMTCFEIAHSDAGKSLWKSGDKQGKKYTRCQASRQVVTQQLRYTIRPSHPLYRALLREYRLPPSRCRKNGGDEEQFDDLDDM